jgi:hypothetical protein
MAPRANGAPIPPVLHCDNLVLGYTSRMTLFGKLLQCRTTGKNSFFISYYKEHSVRRSARSVESAYDDCLDASASRRGCCSRIALQDIRSRASDVAGRCRYGWVWYCDWARLRLHLAFGIWRSGIAPNRVFHWVRFARIFDFQIPRA